MSDFVRSAHHFARNLELYTVGTGGFREMADLNVSELFYFVNTVEEAYKLISDYETKHTVKFAYYNVKPEKQFGNTGKTGQVIKILTDI